MAITIAGLTPSVPLRADGQAQYDMVVTYDELARQNLKNLLLTSPGERMMDPVFGAALRNFLFESSNEATYSKIASKIYQQVARYLPWLEITDIVFDNSNENIDNSSIGLTIYYTVVPLSIQGAFRTSAIRAQTNI